MSLININIDAGGVIKIMNYLTYPIRKPILLIMEKLKKRVDVKGLTIAEKNIIIKFYSDALNEFTSSGQIISFRDKETDNVVDKLCRRKILIFMSEIEQILAYNGYGVKYELNPNAIRILNKNKNDILKVRLHNSSKWDS